MRTSPTERKMIDAIRSIVGVTATIYHQKGVKYTGEISEVGEDFVSIISNEFGTTILPLSDVTGVIVSNNYNK